MSNCFWCLEVLTKYIGFEETNNGKQITLPDEVEIDSLIMFKDWLFKIRDKSFWLCKYCKYDNPIDSEACQICNLPAEVCMFEFSFLS